MDFARDFDVFGNEHFSYITFCLIAFQLYNFSGWRAVLTGCGS